MGFPAWLAIMASIPLVNLVLFYYLALSPWPREGRWNGPGDGPAADLGDGQGDAKF
jgi:hypothetical protein